MKCLFRTVIDFKHTKMQLPAILHNLNEKTSIRKNIFNKIVLLQIIASLLCMTDVMGGA